MSKETRGSSSVEKTSKIMLDFSFNSFSLKGLHFQLSIVDTLNNSNLKGL
jgi:hypothetical protein